MSLLASAQTLAAARFFVKLLKPGLVYLTGGHGGVYEGLSLIYLLLGDTYCNAQVSPAQVGTAQVGGYQVGPNQYGTTQVDITQIGVAETNDLGSTLS
jgi:hypothetical protein